MKFQVQKSHLLEALTIAGKAVGGRLIPILDSYLFEINNNELTVCGSNIEVFISKKIAIEGDFVKNIAIPSNNLMSWVKLLVDQTLLFEVGETAVTIKASSGKVNIPYEDGKNFPKFKIEPEVTFNINGADLIKGLNKTVWATNPDIAHPTYGLLIEVGIGWICLTGTDRHVLSSVTFDLNTDYEYLLVIPEKGLNIIQGICFENANVTISKKNIGFELSNDITVLSSVCTHTFPLYRGVLPKNNELVLSVNRISILNAVKRCNVFSSEEKTITFEMSADGVEISSNNLKEEDIKEVLECDYAGEDLKINFDSRKLIECLSKMSADDIKILLKSDQAPVLLTEEGVSDVMLIMPVYLP